MRWARALIPNSWQTVWMDGSSGREPTKQVGHIDTARSVFPPKPEHLQLIRPPRLPTRQHNLLLEEGARTVVGHNGERRTVLQVTPRPLFECFRQISHGRHECGIALNERAEVGCQPQELPQLLTLGRYRPVPHHINLLARVRLDALSRHHVRPRNDSSERKNSHFDSLAKYECCRSRRCNNTMHAGVLDVLIRSRD